MSAPQYLQGRANVSRTGVRLG